MKKLLSLALALFCLSLAVRAAQAAGETCELPELNMTIEVPKGWYAFTQDVKEDDPVLKFLGINGKGLADFFKKNGVYLDMESADPDARIYVVMADSEYSRHIYDFNLVSDEELKDGMEKVSPEVKKQREKEKITFTEGYIYKHGQAKFYVRNFSKPVSSKITSYGTEYITVINGQDMAFQLLYPGKGERSESLEQTLKSVVDSIVFTKVTSKPIPVAPPPAEYKLPELHLTVDSPEGWFVFTEDVKADDPNLKLLGIDGKWFMDYTKKHAISLQLIDPVSEDEIAVSMADYSDGVDFNEIPDDLLLQPFTKGAEKGADSTFSVYVHKQTKFLILYTDDRTEFFTSINGQIIYITLLPYKNESHLSSIQTLKRVVDNVVFTKVSSAPVSQAGPKGTAFDLPDLNMTIDSPEGWYAFTQDVKEDDMDLRLLGIDGKGLADRYKENGTYLDMVSPDIYARIDVELSGNSRGVSDFIDVPDDYLQFWASMANEKIKTEGTNFSEFSFYTQNQIKFAVCDFTRQADGKAVSGKQYFTIVNGQWIKITLSYNKGGEIPAGYEDALYSAVDSVEFTKVSPKLSSAVPIPDTALFELSELYMTIVSPKGWYVITRDVKEDAPELGLLGIDGAGLPGKYKENGTYMDMEDAISDAGITITMTESRSSREIYDFNSLPEEDILAEAETIAREGEDRKEEQAVFSDFSVFTHAQAKFAVCSFSRQKNNETENGVKYITVKNGKTIDITLNSGEGAISDSLAETMKSTINSITFKEVQPSDDFIAVYASLAGAALGAVIGAAVISIRKKTVGKETSYWSGSINV